MGVGGLVNENDAALFFLIELWVAFPDQWNGRAIYFNTGRQRLRSRILEMETVDPAKRYEHWSLLAGLECEFDALRGEDCGGHGLRVAGNREQEREDREESERRVQGSERMVHPRMQAPRGMYAEVPMPSMRIRIWKENPRKKKKTGASIGSAPAVIAVAAE